MGEDAFWAASGAAKSLVSARCAGVRFWANCKRLTFHFGFTIYFYETGMEQLR
jgi:hypothetical protein